MELPEQVRIDLCRLSAKQTRDYLHSVDISNEPHFSEAGYCSLHLLLTEAVRNVLSWEVLGSFLSSLGVDRAVRWEIHYKVLQFVRLQETF